MEVHVLELKSFAARGHTPRANILHSAKAGARAINWKLSKTTPAPNAPNTAWEWRTTVLPNYFASEPAPHHLELASWSWSIQAGQPAPAYLALWNRGGGKSTNAEAAVVELGARGARTYVLYVRATQDNADKSVQNIAGMLESETFATYYPAMSERSVGKHGNSKGWRRDRLRTASGFIVDALGLDTAARGAKVDAHRPDFIVFDDIDALNDTPQATQKKKDIITKSLLPALAPWGIILFAQNLIISDGIAAQLAGVSEIQADYITDRLPSKPVPAVRDLEVEHVVQSDGTIKHKIVTGTPTWAGMDLERCEALLNKIGLESFLTECQHEVNLRKGALLTPEVIDRSRVAFAPTLDKIAIGVDPPGSSGRCGIVPVGAARIESKLHTYTLEDASTPAGALPAVWGPAVLSQVLKWRQPCQNVYIVVEVNQGGKMVTQTIQSSSIWELDGRQITGTELREADRSRAKLLLDGKTLTIIEVRATDGKRTRAEPMAQRTHEGRHHFVGHHASLEAIWCRWVPGMPSPDPLDAGVWGEFELNNAPEPTNNWQDVLNMLEAING
jgi:hypothetical protein